MTHLVESTVNAWLVLKKKSSFSSFALLLLIPFLDPRMGSLQAHED